MNARILLVIVLLFAGKIFAQTTPRLCATMEQDSLNRLRFPQRGTLEEFEEKLQQKIGEISLRNKFNGGRTQATIISIPIVFHIVHNGEAVGSGTNLSQAQVIAQLEVMNEDFRRQVGTPGFNDSPVGADIEIEFCLSPVDEKGNVLAEPGIHRYKGSKAAFTRNEIEASLKPTTIWNPNLFYNVWTVKFDVADASLLGYAQFPDQSGLAGLNEQGGPSTTDGVVISYAVCGSVNKGTFPVMQAPYNKGRTLVHETGHWLGLRHIWGDGSCANDFVADTPTQQSESRGCPTGKLSCDGSTPAMVQNYMDYSDDACMNIFTKGQKARMLAVMELSPRRKTLYQANLCSPVVADVPTANFTADKQFVLLGGEVNFTDLSTNFPTSWSWTFEGADPSSSTDRNPKVKYNTPGVFKVTLVSTNSLGSSAPLTQEAYIEVSTEGLCSQLSNFADTYTPSILNMADVASFTGYLTGHNSAKSQAYSEFFLNSQGYKYVSGVDVKFGVATSTLEDATINVTVWNARGPQNAPGSVIERKQVLLKQIQEDVQNDRVTSIVFDRETPVFSRPFQVGVEISYDNNSSVAIISSANGEASNATSWIKDANSVWKPFSIAFGANIALDIKPFVGVNPSIQVSASKLIVAPGEEVVLNGKGASIFVWSANDGSVENVAGPQIVVNPNTTTTYTVVGSGLELCNSVASTTIYASGFQTPIEELIKDSDISVYPNPGSTSLGIEMTNNFKGSVTIDLYGVLGNKITNLPPYEKTGSDFKTLIETSPLKVGIYVLKIKLNNQIITRKWAKQ